MCFYILYSDNCGASCRKDFKICTKSVGENERENGWCSLHGHFSEPVCPYCVRGY